MFIETADVAPSDVVLPPRWRGQIIGRDPDSIGRPCVWHTPAGFAHGYEAADQSLISQERTHDLGYAMELAVAVTRESCL